MYIIAINHNKLYFDKCFAYHCQNIRFHDRQICIDNKYHFESNQVIRITESETVGYPIVLENELHEFGQFTK